MCILNQISVRGSVVMKVGPQLESWSAEPGVADLIESLIQPDFHRLVSLRHICHVCIFSPSGTHQVLYRKL